MKNNLKKIGIVFWKNKMMIIIQNFKLYKDQDIRIEKKHKIFKNLKINK